MPIKFHNAAGTPNYGVVDTVGVTPVHATSPLSNVAQFNAEHIKAAIRHINLGKVTGPNEIKKWFLSKHMPLAVHKPKPHFWFDGEKICHLIPDEYHAQHTHEEHALHEEDDDELEAPAN